MANNSTHFSAVPSEVLLFSVVFKFIAMIIGILGNMTVIIYSILTNKEKTATSYLVGNLAMADLLVCVTFYPMSIIEFTLTILNIDSDQNLFCKLSRSTIWSLLFASVSTLLAITVDRYLYIVKPLKYPMIVTKGRVFLAISGIWLTACCLFVFLLVHWRRFDFKLRSFCDTNKYMQRSIEIFVYLPLTLILILNIRILIVAEKQRKRIFAETAVPITASDGQPKNKMSATIHKFFHAVKALKTFSIVVAVLAFCVLTPTVVGLVLRYSCSLSCEQMWYVVFNYELYGINSIVNAFIYGMRHIKYRRAYRHILFKIRRCNQPSD
ncbi:Alpha-1A adrenergic receptor [Paramuricea clavata]|uniref:Alpha-1A adrenergic receptor, partial n=1 Tax=Paramuricea clavata TaxID=317549 RepID=A0A6S7G0F2_PARCT|nr:Alpha-1A adrenergic receptor [Paramuricea clavata]